MTCYIFGAGERPAFVPPMTGGDMLIAADGGMEECRRRGLVPDLLIGDFDSLASMPEGVPTRRLPVKKDVTDMAAAVEVGRAAGATRFLLFGGTGGRADHTFANYQLIADIAGTGAEAYLIGAAGNITAITAGTGLRFPAGARGNLSVFAVGGEAHGVTECGTKYTLTDATLSPTVPLGVSNALIGKRSCVSVGEGTLLVFWEGEYLPDRGLTNENGVLQ